jgi:hypothetical protein
MDLRTRTPRCLLRHRLTQLLCHTIGTDKDPYGRLLVTPQSLRVAPLSKDGNPLIDGRVGREAHARSIDERGSRRRMRGRLDVVG